LASVVNGLTKSCGCLKPIGHKYQKPILISKDVWLKEFPQLLDINLPDCWSRSTSKVFSVRCKCGNIYQRAFAKLKQNSTCKKCKVVELSSLFNRRYGKLVCCDKRNINIHIGSEQLVRFVCDCGNIKDIKLGAVTRGSTTSCNECNIKPTEWWLNQKFGHLTVTYVPDKTSVYSERHIECLCSCGNTCKKRASELVHNHVLTCGKCYELGLKWWSKKISLSYFAVNSDIKYPLSVLKLYFSGSYLEPLESAKSLNKYIKFNCKLCNSEFVTNLSWVCHSKIVSCGCVHGSISRANIEIASLLQQYGLKVLYGKDEHKIDQYSIDIFVPSLKLVIEHHGLRYHSDSLGCSKKQQLDKWKKCLSAGYRFLAIYEDEWKKKRPIIEDLILNAAKLNKPTYKLRPQKCTVIEISSKLAADFCNDYHYIGGIKSISLAIGVFYDTTLIACMVLKRPSRQNSGDYEIARMIKRPDYHINGIWSYLLSWLRKNTTIKGNLITFSDNRLFDGRTYHNMGFTYCGDVAPDYYWTTNHKRHHKSTLRKTDSERLTGKTEIRLRTEQGYHKIWDYGKKKWQIMI